MSTHNNSSLFILDYIYLIRSPLNFLGYCLGIGIIVEESIISIGKKRGLFGLLIFILMICDQKWHSDNKLDLLVLYPHNLFLFPLLSVRVSWGICVSNRVGNKMITLKIPKVNFLISEKTPLLVWKIFFFSMFLFYEK